MTQELASDAFDEESVYRRLSERAIAGGNLMAGALLTLVAEETSTGEVVGMVNAGPPGKWSHHAITQLPAPMVHQLHERVVEVSDIAALPASRRQGIGAGLLNAALNSDSETAQAWRLALCFFHQGMGMGAFHRAMASEWPTGQPIAFLDSARNVALFRTLTGDLRACGEEPHGSAR
ncbi:GNAT family N-acetyltransferase [Streptomyces sp. NPDC090445]|uniref:GNAT family N-acetyltransferase n=1 Tax=Streptomyces sp. NPDC090445 TaxID=3365963 RepID=UPI00381D3D34